MSEFEDKLGAILSDRNAMDQIMALARSFSDTEPKQHSVPPTQVCSPPPLPEEPAQLLAGDASLERVELLPYQKTAGAKYRTVGREYRESFDLGDALTFAAEPFEQYGLRCKIL